MSWYKIMDSKWSSSVILIYALFLVCFSANYVACDSNPSATLTVNALSQYGRKIPETLFGVFFEEINNAGTGGLWAELVNNRGFEQGGQDTPSDFSPWGVIGNSTVLSAGTDRSSLFKRNPVALRMDVNCDGNECPSSGVGVYNPGFWGMNIEDGKTYKLTLYVKSSDSFNISVSLTTSDGLMKLASTNIIASSASVVSDWTKVQVELVASGSTDNGRLQLTTKKKGTIWLDQVSLMPADTYKGHGFRKDLFAMVADLKPAFIRFPGGCYIEGDRLWNAFRWSASVGPWEERPGHYGDVWNYWTDDGLGYYELLQLAEDLGAAPVWVISNGISHKYSVDPSEISFWVQDALNSIEFARGDKTTTWGKLRAQMGHPDPFSLNHMAIGNEDCSKPHYRANYMKFYKAIRSKYPDIKLITDCDLTDGPIDHPADLSDYHVYTTAADMFKRKDVFNNVSRTGPKAFVSEYAVWKQDGGKGTFLASLGEAGFLIGLEKNSDIVSLASYAPLFVNTNNQGWNPDAIVFNSSHVYGSPSYWMQHFFINSNGAILSPTSMKPDMPATIAASAIIYNNTDDKTSYLRIKIVNFGSDTVNLKINVTGLQYSINARDSSKTIMTSDQLMDENSFSNPTKVVPVTSVLTDANTQMDVKIIPHSITSYDLALGDPISDPDLNKRPIN
ncbi:hypothetical protein LUZ60_005978 [Juncus effusus]|nr:hypothetical protein LUZ60_005978 [Juncus effusus]